MLLIQVSNKRIHAKNMKNLAQVRDKISQTRRVDYSKLSIHYKLKACMDNAPHLNPYDYDGLLQVVSSWFVNDNFRYSELDRWIEGGIDFLFNSSTFRITGDKHCWDLKYNSGVCCNLALKCKVMIEILYPWANPLIAEKKGWRGQSSNHYFILLPTKGVKCQVSGSNDSNYIETNSYFVDYDDLDALPYASYRYDLLGDVYIIDPTRSFIGLRNNHELYQVELLSQYFIKPDFVFTTKTVNQLMDRTSQEYNYYYAHRFNTEEFGNLFLGYNNKICAHGPVWNFNQILYDFECQILVERISQIDQDAAAKIRIIQNRGLITT
jgi:hypothetical protein